MFVSVMTPTYNRGYILGQCYASLIDQTDSDFEWIVVDDGSTDDTEALVKSWQAEGKICLRYIKQENGGKQRAHNAAVRVARGELCVCLDSDDMLSPDAIAVARQVWQNQREKNSIGILAKRGDPQTHAPICGTWPADLTSCRMMELQQKYHFSGDTVLFFDTALLQQHYFAEFDGENFVSEDSLYAVLDRYGSMILVDQVIYYCAYLEDGLTAKFFQLLRENPMGTAYCFYERTISSQSLVDKLHNAIISQAFLLHAQKKRAYVITGDKAIFCLAGLVAPIYRKLRIQRK